MSVRAARFFWPVFWTVLVLAAFGMLLALSSTAREVAREAATTLFGIVTTPFIFEATVALIGLLLVLGINHWRIKKEGDGWVYLVSKEQDAGAAKLPAAITQRLQGVVMQEKPEAMDEAGTARANIEGFLELGMAAQAAEALTESQDLPDDEATAALRIRVLAANLDTDAARDLLHASTKRFGGSGVLFAQTALDCADWLEAHAPQHAHAVQCWHDEVKLIVR